MTGRSSIWVPAPGPDRSRKLHETIAPSNHRFPFLAVRSSRPAWLLMWRGPHRLPRGQISCHFRGSSYFFCSALQCPFIRHMRFLCWGWFWPPFVLFLTHICRCEMNMLNYYTHKSHDLPSRTSGFQCSLESPQCLQNRLHLGLYMF